MQLSFKGKNSDKDVWVHSIIFHLADGRYVTVNRNITKYYVVDGNLEMEWVGCYSVNNDKRGNDYRLKASDFKDANLVDITLRGDAPAKYEIQIDAWKAEDR